MGALTFHPGAHRGPGLEEALDVRDLVVQARHVIEGDTDVAIPEIMQIGSSAGGARAKALILWDREQNRARSGFAKPQPGEEHWLIKFDDHPKNFAMLMNSDGVWALAPAYHVAYAEGGPWTQQHQMSIGGKFGDFTRADLLGFGSTFDLSEREASQIITEVQASLDGWHRYAKAAEVPKEKIAYLDGRFERLSVEGG